MSDKKAQPTEVVEEGDLSPINQDDVVVESEVEAVLVDGADNHDAAEIAESVADQTDPLAGLDMIKQLGEAQAEIASLKDQMLRTLADAQNTKRRAEQDVTKAHKFGVEKFASEMLPIVDSMAMALQANESDEGAQGLRDGVEMTLKMLLAALEKFNVVQIDPQGEVFDPALHQAMSMVDGGAIETNKVVAVMQKGFTISGRLLRPAMVMVAK
ncbi:MAG: hsp 24 DnaK nucleotide exchange factor [Osedax symbiont Rs1]|nr:MAG: hsp 24 DnaK nucleotide exchange factor [Osedax symbiont Rs1]